MVPDPYRDNWSPYEAMNNNPVNIVDPNGGQGDPKEGDLNKEGTHVWGLNGINNKYQWIEVSDAVEVTPTFKDNKADWLNLLQSIFSSNPKIGVWFEGHGLAGNIFAGRDWTPGMEIIVVKVDDMTSFLSFFNRSDLKRPSFGSDGRTVVNPNIQERMENVAEALSKIDGASDILYGWIKDQRKRIMFENLTRKADSVLDWHIQNIDRTSGRSTRQAKDSSYITITTWGTKGNVLQRDTVFRDDQ
jgi:hypothetical protein